MLTLARCISDVSAFHAKFGIDVNPLDDAAQYDLRVKRQTEEFDELIQSMSSADSADAVIDIIYIAAGTIDLLKDRNGVPGEDHIYVQKGQLEQIFNSLVDDWKALPLVALWEEVHSANMRKERGTEGTSKYGNKYDIVKPEGWTPPDIAKVLVEAGLDPLSAPGTYSE